MSEKITVVYIEQTGHILAALTRAADAEAEPVVAELAGEALPVRRLGDPAEGWFADAQFFVPAAELKAKSVELKPGMIENPRSFYLDENGEAQPLDATFAVDDATLNGTQIEVKVNAAAKVEKAAVWIHVTDQDLAKAQTQTDEKAENNDKVNVNISPLSAGTHYVLTLVAKTPPNAFKL